VRAFLLVIDCRVLLVRTNMEIRSGYAGSRWSFSTPHQSRLHRFLSAEITLEQQISKKKKKKKKKETVVKYVIVE
jgi:hypothetical protein